MIQHKSLKVCCDCIKYLLHNNRFHKIEAALGRQQEGGLHQQQQQQQQGGSYNLIKICSINLNPRGTRYKKNAVPVK